MTEPKHQSVTVGRYLLHRQIARGGMATIHIARLMGDEGFSRIVAAKRLLPEFAEDTEFVAMFMDEARIASKVHHPNVVPVLDLVTTTDEVMLVQEYVHGVPLHILLRTAHEASTKIPVRIAVSIATQVLAGLHAAHTTLDEMGEPLNIVHRDVSPQNVMVALDGSARLLDFGVAKATMAAHVTKDGTFKGKLAYSAPEQVRGRPVQQSDVYALSVVLWELLVGHRMHGRSQGEAELVATILNGAMPSITEALSNESDWGAIDSDEWKSLVSIEGIVKKGLAVELENRYTTAADMAFDLAKAVPPASSSEVAAWVKSLGKDFIGDRDKIIAAEEQSWRSGLQAQGGTISRRTPLPGELKRAATQPAVDVKMPPAPASSNSGKTVIAVLGMLVVLLGVGVVYAVQASDAPPAQGQSVEAAAEPVRPEVLAPEREPVVAPAPTPAPETTADKPEPVEPEPVAEAEPQPAEPSQTTVAPVDNQATHKGQPTRRAPLRPAPRPAAKLVAKVPAALPPPPPPPPAPVVEEKKPEPKVEKNDCATPYYFEGQKKVFKPNCL